MSAPDGGDASRPGGPRRGPEGSWAPLEEPEPGEEGAQAPGPHTAMLRTAREFFQTCDREGKGFIARRDLQKLHQELPLSPAELEAVFNALDADGDGFLTPEEFTTGFSHFFFRHGSRGGEGPAPLGGERVYQSPGDGGDTGQDQEAQFRMLMDKLGAQKVLEDEGGLRQLWRRLGDEPHLLSGLEDLLGRVCAQLQEAQDEKSELERALQRKIAAYDGEIQHLYTEMEQQIQKEREQFLLKDSARFQARSQELEGQLLSKEQELERLLQQQSRLEGRVAALQSDSQARGAENARLRRSNQELRAELERAGRELRAAEAQRQSLQREARRLHRHAEAEVYLMSERLGREKSGLLKQLDLLRERNKHLRDERDACVQRDAASGARGAAPKPGCKQRSGSVIGKYLDGGGLPRSQSEEDEDAFGLTPGGGSCSPGPGGSPAAEEEPGGAPGGPGASPPRGPLGRIISIEEDPLPQLLEADPAPPTPSQRAEEEEETEAEGPGADPGPRGAPRGQPVGRDALGEAPRPPGPPERLFKVLLVGDSAVGKTSLLQRLCERRCGPGAPATVGIDYRVTTVVVDGSRVALQLWDTAGQERYRSVTQQFFRRADGVVVVYDLTAQRSFLSVRRWLSDVEEAVGARVPVLLLANKLDNEKEREVPRGHGEKLAKENELIFYECSAYSGHNAAESLLHLARFLKEQEDSVRTGAVHVAASAKKKACCG